MSELESRRRTLVLAQSAPSRSEVEEKAKELIDNSSTKAIGEVIKGLSRHEVKEIFLALGPEDLATVSRILAGEDTILFAARGEDSLELCDLMPRMMVERIVRGQNVLSYYPDIYEFDTTQKQYVKVRGSDELLYKKKEDLTYRGDISLIAFIPGTEDFVTLDGKEAFEWVNFEPRLIATSEKENSELLLVLRDGTVFIVERKKLGEVSSGDSILVEIAPNYNVFSVETGINIIRAFPLGDNILVSGERSAEIRDLNLELLHSFDLPEVVFQLSPTKFVLDDPENKGKEWKDMKSLISRYKGGAEFQTLQKVPKVKGHISHDTLICTEEYKSVILKFDGKKYIQIVGVRLGDYTFPVGTSLVHTYPAGGYTRTKLWKLGRFGIREFQEISGAKTCHFLPSTPQSRKYLVDKLGTLLGKIPVELVDIVVGFL